MSLSFLISNNIKNLLIHYSGLKINGTRNAIDCGMVFFYTHIINLIPRPQR